MPEEPEQTLEQTPPEILNDVTGTQPSQDPNVIVESDEGVTELEGEGGD